MLLAFLIALAVLIFFKLFREFGKSREIIINMSATDKEKLKKTIEDLVAVNSEGEKITPETKVDDELVKNTGDLQKKFPDFSTVSFLSRAEEMFDSIFNAFANSHHHILKAMLTEDLYESFASQIQKRESKNLRQELLIKHKKTNLEKIQLFAEKAQLFVNFDISQMTSMVNSDGVSFDNPKRLYREVIHKWIFERNFEKSDWVLLRTSSVETY